MSIANNASRNGIVNRNAGVIAGLRDVADFLEAHPDLPSFNGYVMHSAYGKDAREKLTAIARALGDAAVETATPAEVRITGAFAGVQLSAYSSPDRLGASPVPRVDYEPIIAREPIAEVKR